MKIDKIKKELKNRNIKFTDFGNNYIEFTGKITNSDGINFSVEGSLELLNENEFVYSVYFTDLNSKKEYDAEIGNFINLTEENLSKTIDYIFNCDFVELA